MTKRYVVRTGKWGTYFMDSHTDTPLDNEAVRTTLNAYEQRVKDFLEIERTDKATVERLRTQLRTANDLHANQADLIREFRGKLESLGNSLSEAQAKLDAKGDESPCEQQLRIIKQLRAQIEDLGGRPNVGPEKRPSLGTTSSMLDYARSMGWAVASHNDYRMGNQDYTFWLFTKNGHAVKGEGRSDPEALAIVRTRIDACERRWAHE